METKGVIFEGKTLDDAVKKGLHALGLSRAEVMITVEEEGSGGFLGIGGRPYRVRMMPRPRREMPERRERGERSGREGRERRDSRQRREPARSERRGPDNRGRRDSREVPAGRELGRDARNGRGRPPGRPEMPPRAEARGEERGERRGRRRRRPGDGEGRTEVARESRFGPGREPRVGPARDQDRGRRPAEADRGPAGATAVGEFARGDAPAVSPEELISTVQRLADDLFKVMGFEARLTVETDGSSVGVRAEVPTDSELLTGEKGEVRQALQHLLNRMLNKGQVSRYHVQLEINDYWRQREGELQDLARRLADDAVAENTEKLTEYLNAQERRIVHVTLREDSRVRTYALGDGLIKKVAVAPADHPEEQKPDE